MATLVVAGSGLQWTRNRGSSSPNYAVETRYIKKGAAAAIGINDAVFTQNSGSGAQGYIAPYAEAGTAILGIFAGCQPYFDTNLMSVVDKPNYTGTESPSSDIPVWVIVDPNAVFIAQLNAGTATMAYIGQNIDIANNGIPVNGQSVALLDNATLATTSTLPLRIIGFSPRAAMGFDPTSQTPGAQPTNGYLEVVFNPGACESLLGTGV